MVRELKCNCEKVYEAEINSYQSFKALEFFFNTDVETGMYEDIPITKPLQLYDNLGNVVTEWYPDKWYKCKYCGQLWALEYPDFPAKGYLYKLDEKGYWHDRKK